MKPAEVFTPGAFPIHTYVVRSDSNIEQQLAAAISVQGQIIALSGPSKSRKTVMIEHIIGRDNLITVTGAGVKSVDDVWNRILDWMNVPNSSSRGSDTTGAASGQVGLEASAKILGLASLTGQATGTVGVEHGRSKQATFTRGGMQQVIDEVGNSDFVILIDDFHYMPRQIQADVARSIKEAARLGVKICTASVPHRGDDVVRANSELRGRVTGIDLKFWPKEDLKKIAGSGFSALNLQIDDHIIERFAAEAAGSPQLMQLICLNACFALGISRRAPFGTKVEVPDDILARVLEQASASTNFRSLFDVLDAGPKTRGIERKMYAFRDGSEGDVYRSILRAVASDPPRLSFDYGELTRRVSNVCQSDAPVGSSIVGTCLHMGKLALDKFPEERAIDWDEQTQILDILDPYLLFYLRWSGRLKEGN